MKKQTPPKLSKKSREDIHWNNVYLSQRITDEIKRYNDSFELVVEREFNAEAGMLGIIPSSIEIIYLVDNVAFMHDFYFGVGFLFICIVIVTINFAIIGWLFSKKRIVRKDRFSLV